jgi:hypothetical protein
VTRRTLISLCAVVLSIGLVAPGIAQEGDGPSFDPVATISKKGFKKTRKLAKQSNQRLNALEVASAQVSGDVTTTAPIGSYVAGGGPSVTVTVPDSGLIEVWAQAEIRNDDGGAVGLFQDGAKVPGISEPDYCGDDSALIEMEGGGPGDFDVFSTPPTVNLVFGCLNFGAPSPVLVQTTPGQHTFELRYSACQCGGSGTFRHRVLRVAARP